MKLKELAQTTGVPVTSIKFYLREGLLPVGEKLNATTAAYDQRHVDRLALITTLRQAVELPLDRVAALTTAVDDETISRVDLMGVVQSTVLDAGAPAPTGRDDAPVVDDAPVGNDALVRDDAPSLRADDVVAAMAWMPGTDRSMAALDEQLARLRTWGLAPTRDTLMRYARAADLVAATDLRSTRPELAPEVSRDQIARYVALGVHGYAQLLLRLLAVAQGAHARAS